jgi:hypothetical protein
VIDWIWSTALYSSAMVGVAGVIGMIRPTKRLHRRSRRRAVIMLAAAAIVAFAVILATPAAMTSSAGLGIDEFSPVFHFREHHSTVVAAPPERVFAAIKTVSADEIALFNLFTAIRRFGRPGPESIMNAPGQQPILDVATRTGFLLLVNRPPREVAVGAVVVAPPGTRRPGEFTADHYRALTQPGFGKATMNFVVEDLGNGSSRIDTETRVYATDAVALRRFTPYWRIIFPGSAILRITWLQAIKAKAEQAGG